MEEYVATQIKDPLVTAEVWILYLFGYTMDAFSF